MVARKSYYKYFGTVRQLYFLMDVTDNALENLGHSFVGHSSL